MQTQAAEGASSQPSQTDIAIVGGGMVGISLALLLARENPQWHITVLEAFPLNDSADLQYRSSFDARSTALSAGSRNILESCGIWSSLRQHLTCIRQVQVSDRGHFGGSVIDAREHRREAVGYVVENAWLGQVLTAQLRARSEIHFRAPATVDAVRATAGGYRITLSGEPQETLDCELLIVADGVNSRLRSRIGIELEEHDYHQSALVANVRCGRPHGGVAYERFTGEGPIALLPLGESDQSHTMALVWTRPQDRINELCDCTDRQFLDALQSQFGYRQGIFEEVGVRHVYPLKLSLAKEQIRRSLVLMGNAAHSLHPVAGQGFNLALRDCEALATTLARTQASGRRLSDPGVLERYLESQSSDQWLTTQLGDSFVRWFSSEQAGRSLLRNLGLFTLDALPLAKRLLARQTMGLAGRL